jgi:hypothetical protein
VPIALKSASLNLLEPSEAVQGLLFFLSHTPAFRAMNEFMYYGLKQDF